MSLRNCSSLVSLSRDGFIKVMITKFWQLSTEQGESKDLNPKRMRMENRYHQHLLCLMICQVWKRRWIMEENGMGMVTYLIGLLDIPRRGPKLPDPSQSFSLAGRQGWPLRDSMKTWDIHLHRSSYCPKGTRSRRGFFRQQPKTYVLDVSLAKGHHHHLLQSCPLQNHLETWCALTCSTSMTPKGRS